MNKRSYEEVFDLDKDSEIRELKAQLWEKKKEVHKRQKIRELKDELARLEYHLELQ